MRSTGGLWPPGGDESPPLSVYRPHGPSRTSRRRQRRRCPAPPMTAA